MLQKIDPNLIEFKKRGRKNGSGKTKEYEKAVEINTFLLIGEATEVESLSRSSLLVYLNRLDCNKKYTTTKIIEEGINKIKIIRTL